MFNFLPLVLSKSSFKEMMIIFFHAPGLRLIIPDTALFNSEWDIQMYSTPSEGNDDMSVLVAVIHFRVAGRGPFA